MPTKNIGIEQSNTEACERQSMQSLVESLSAEVDDAQAGPTITADGSSWLPHHGHPLPIKPCHVAAPYLG
jgi:hypothetical protein